MARVQTDQNQTTGFPVRCSYRAIRCYCEFLVASVLHVDSCHSYRANAVVRRSKPTKVFMRYYRPTCLQSLVSEIYLTTSTIYYSEHNWTCTTGVKCNVLVRLIPPSHTLAAVKPLASLWEGLDVNFTLLPSLYSRLVSVLEIKSPDWHAYSYTLYLTLGEETWLDARNNKTTKNFYTQNHR